jgi:hypothetical protein
MPLKCFGCDKNPHLGVFQEELCVYFCIKLNQNTIKSDEYETNNDFSPILPGLYDR